MPKTRNNALLVSGLVAVAIALLGVFFLFRANDLGLTRFDLSVGGQPPLAVLRENTQAAADAFLARHKGELTTPAGGDDALTVDYSKSAKIQSLGYRSSFYYYCWDIYLPYSLGSQKELTVLVHLSDGTHGHGHDLGKFRVLSVKLLDQRGQVIKQVDENASAIPSVRD